MTLSQANRDVAVATPLGDDVLVFKSMTGTEQLGRLFQYDLELLSEDPAISHEKILGQNITVTVGTHNDSQRFINGYVSRFTQLSSSGRNIHYQATIRPWLWFLTRTADCRIFQQMKVPDIVDKIFRDHGFTDFKLSLNETYREWEYCVQYRETDFNFVSRLMEQEGIYYFYKHENGKHTVVLVDSPSAHGAGDHYETIPYYPRDEGALRERDHIYDLQMSKQVQTGIYAHTDFDFKKPKQDLTSQRKIVREHAAADYEIYDYPGEFVKSNEGDTYARTRIEELQAQHESVRGQGNTRGLCTGNQFTLENYRREDQNRKYLLVATTYQFVGGDYESSGTDAATECRCTFEAIDAEQPYRAARVTPKPSIQGPQTGIIVGPKGDEIHTDEFGRAKVKFHWDRYGEADDSASCWVRIAQVWAGKKWGGIYLPRVGQEVIVDFLEGDPDRPIITGRVYNGDNKPPYPLPAEATKSTIKSNSSKGGGGFNEIRFEDKKDKEQVFIHAQKDFDHRTKNDSREWIGHDQHLIIKNDRFEWIEKNAHLKIDADRLEEIGGEAHLKVLSDRKTEISASDHLKIASDHNLKTGGDTNVDSGANHNHKVGQDFSLDAGMNVHQKAGMNIGVDGGMNVHIKAGMSLVLEAGIQVTLKAAGGFVTVGPAGVDISGPMVKINSGGAAGSGGGAKPKKAASPQAPDAPKEAEEADSAEAGEVAEVAAKKAKKKKQKTKATRFKSPQAATLAAAAKDGTPFCEECEAAKNGGA